jgi:hypothetical protein
LLLLFDRIGKRRGTAKERPFLVRIIAFKSLLCVLAKLGWRVTTVTLSVVRTEQGAIISMSEVCDSKNFLEVTKGNTQSFLYLCMRCHASSYTACHRLFSALGGQTCPVGEASRADAWFSVRS